MKDIVERFLMQPIHELLSRIRWDRGFRGEFEIAFVDHMRTDLIRVRVRDINLDKGGDHSFEMIDENERCITIPLHRIREVYRDGQLIWRRPEA